MALYYNMLYSSKNLLRMISKVLNQVEQRYKQHNLLNFNACILSTASKNNTPNSRVVLIKEVSSKGLIFFTNYNSVKANEIEENNQVSMLFYWLPLNIQLRIQGTIQKTSSTISDSYFESRPYISKIGAYSSKQSTHLQSRDLLLDNVEKFKLKYPNNVKRPSFWGGYIIKPTTIELWKDQPFRLHKRSFYKIDPKNNKWHKQLLFP